MGDLIMAVNGTKLPGRTSEDEFLSLLVATPRPVELTFKCPL